MLVLLILEVCRYMLARHKCRGTSCSLEGCLGDRGQEVRAATLRAYRALVRDMASMNAVLARRHFVILVVRYGDSCSRGPRCLLRVTFAVCSPLLPRVVCPLPFLTSWTPLPPPYTDR